MQIQDFNHSGAPQERSLPEHPPEQQGAAGADPAALDDRASVEISLLKAQIEHLELVVETARSLMTSNQERLLRRLHDLPREMAALTARLDRLDNPGRLGTTPNDRSRTPIRRVV
jgi:hypothetical protein